MTTGQATHIQRMSKLLPSTSVEPDLRLKVIRTLSERADHENIDEDILCCRDIEAAIHASAFNKSEYVDKVQQVIHNLTLYPNLWSLKDKVVCMTNRQLSKNTLIENIENETRLRRLRFEAMLQNKYQQTNDDSCKSTLKCRRCGSSEVQVEQKQTRGADEAMTIFCTCSKCSQRWTMR